MPSTFQQFKNLHRAPGLFVLPNIWNAKSAILFQEKKFPAIATSSMAVANSLGYEDGENMPFNDYLFVINRILNSVKIPLSVDIEMGYGSNDKEIYDNILRLLDLGVVGINIEDSTTTKAGRRLKDAKLFAKTIEFIKSKLGSKGLNLFMNIRCDTYLLNVKNRQQEASDRVKMYESAGADGIFLPCIYREEDIAEAVSATTLPVNVMCIPRLPGFDILNELGVKRVSMGGFLFNKVYETINHLSRDITINKDFSPINHN
jgi:2-methylisocitrate lyase-like PEP mutase family enzyme